MTEYRHETCAKIVRNKVSFGICEPRWFAIGIYCLREIGRGSCLLRRARCWVSYRGKPPMKNRDKSVKGHSQSDFRFYSFSFSICTMFVADNGYNARAMCALTKLQWILKFSFASAYLCAEQQKKRVNHYDSIWAFAAKNSASNCFTFKISRVRRTCRSLQCFGLEQTIA